MLSQEGVGGALWYCGCPDLLFYAWAHILKYSPWQIHTYMLIYTGTLSQELQFYSEVSHCCHHQHLLHLHIYYKCRHDTYQHVAYLKKILIYTSWHNWTFKPHNLMYLNNHINVILTFKCLDSLHYPGFPSNLRFNNLFEDQINFWKDVKWHTASISSMPYKTNKLNKWTDFIVVYWFWANALIDKIQY